MELLLFERIEKGEGMAPGNAMPERDSVLAMFCSGGGDTVFLVISGVALNVEGLLEVMM